MKFLLEYIYQILILVNYYTQKTLDMNRLFFLMLCCFVNTIVSAQNCGEKDLTCWEKKARSGDKMLKGANLEGANLEGVNLENCVLSQANLRGANLKKANLNNANFEGAILDSAVLDNIKSSNVDFSGASLRKVFMNFTTFFSCNFAKANFFAANWTYAEISSCNFEEANLQSLHLSYGTITDCNFKKTILKNAEFFNRPKLLGCVFEEASFFMTDFNEVELFKCKFIKPNFEITKFRNCWFSECDFTKVDFTKVNGLDDCSFTDGKLEEADFSGKKAENISFERCYLVLSKFVAFEFKNPSFRESILNGADFSDCKGLKKAHIKNCTTNGFTKGLK